MPLLKAETFLKVLCTPHNCSHAVQRFTHLCFLFSIPLLYSHVYTIICVLFKSYQTKEKPSKCHPGNVHHVVMYDFPLNMADYLHRVGRTARGGRAGRVTTITPRRYWPFVAKIQEATKEGLAE